MRDFLACVCLTAFEAFQPPLPQNLALQKGRRISGARFSRGSSAFQPLRLPSLPSPKTLGAVFCAWLRHPVSARLSEAVCLGLSLCGSLPSLLGSGFPSFLPQSSLCCLPLAASPPLAGNGFPWCASFSTNACWPPFKAGRYFQYMPWFVVLLLGRGLFFGAKWFWGFNISFSLCACCLAGVYFGALVFWAWLWWSNFQWARCICGLQIDFFVDGSCLHVCVCMLF